MAMRTTVALDDELVRIAEEMTGISEKASLIKHVFKSFIERESARRLAALGGTMPDLEYIPRRKESDDTGRHNRLDRSLPQGRSKARKAS
jgi:Arc/MetJ family transcription regulator